MNIKESFSVAVIATMSSGKSTTINAMLGVPLLPSMNEACTATVYKIEDIDGLKHFNARYIQDGIASDWEEIDHNEDKLAEWNSFGFESIEVQGDFPHIDNHKKIISFIDTPGPNNSTDKSHSEITHDILSGCEFGYVLCIMNASHFGVDDERILLASLLEELDKKDKKIKVVFAVNKMDQLDVEAGESPKKLIDNIRKYLNELGFSRPMIIPIMSLASLEIREVIEAHKKEIELPFSNRKQKKILRDIECLFEFEADYKLASLNTKARDKCLSRAIDQARCVDKKELVMIASSEIEIGKLIEADIITGIPLLEELLEIELLKNCNSYYKPKKFDLRKTAKFKRKQKSKSRSKKQNKFKR